MSFLPWDDGEASLAETLVDQAVLPERPEPAIPQEVQCFLAEVLIQDVLHVCNVLRKGGEVGKEPFRPFCAHMEPVLAESWVPFPGSSRASSAATSEAPAVGVGVGHLARTTSVGPGSPTHQRGKVLAELAVSSRHEEEPYAIPKVGQVPRGQRLREPACRRRHQAVEVVRRYYLVRLVHRNAREFQELSESEGWLPASCLPSSAVPHIGPAAPRLSVSGR